MKWLKNITSFCVWITQIQPWLWVADSKAQLELQMALDCDTRFTPACVARKIPNLDFKHFTAACAYLCPGPCYGQGNGVLPLPHVCSEVSASASPSHGPSPSLWAQQRSAWAEKAWQSNTSQKAKLQLKILQPKIVLTFFFKMFICQAFGTWEESLPGPGFECQRRCRPARTLQPLRCCFNFNTCEKH